MATSSPDLTSLLAPRSIAVIGASADRRKNSGKPLNFLKEHGYRGQVYPINPRHAEMLGWRCYASVADVPGEIDLAVIALPAEHVAAAIEQCGQKGVHGAVILTSGFAELGTDGAAMERKLVDTARDHGVRLCGPNSVGLIVARTGVVASFSQSADGKELSAGGMALVSQSGNFGTFMIELAARREISFSHFVSTGNEADLTFLDFAEHLIADPDVQVLVGYVEGLRDANRLRRLGELAKAKRKPVVILKVGRSAVAARAAASHTGAMVGDDVLCDAAFRQAGILRAYDEEEVLDMVPLLTSPRLPRGRRVAIVSISGGGATILSDACSDAGLTVPEFSEKTRAVLREVVPYYGMVANPVDLTGQVLSGQGLLRHCVTAAAADEGIDSVVVFLSLLHGLGERIADEVLEAQAVSSKPIVVSWVAGPAEQIARLRKAGVPVTTAPSTACVRSLGHAALYAEWLEGMPPLSKAPCSAAAAGADMGVQPVSGSESRALLSDIGIPVLPHAVADSPELAVSAATRLGFPVCVKLERPVLAHKTEANAVRLGLASAGEVAQAADELLALGRKLAPRVSPQVLVEPMAAAGTELMLSLRRDPQFGASLHLALGGVHAEIYRDMATRLLPVSEVDLASMTEELKAAPLLKGYRNTARTDIPALLHALARLAHVGDSRPDIALVEINPFRLGKAGDGGVALDALVLKSPPQ